MTYEETHNMAAVTACNGECCTGTPWAQYMREYPNYVVHIPPEWTGVVP